MTAVHFTTDGEQGIGGLEAKTSAGYMTAVYEGSLGGGTLRFFATIDGHKAPIPNSKLSAATVDDNGDLISMIIFSASGTLSVSLAGATAPDVWVAVK